MLTYDPEWFEKNPKPRRVAVYTPTRQYGGLDVTVASLARQDLPADCSLTWFLADDIAADRASLPAVKELLHRIPVHYWHSKTKPGYVRNLAATNNHALKLARDIDADMLIFLQDYIWAPPDGVRRFLWLAEAMDMPCLLTGLTHLTDDPEPDKVTNPTGLYTIFAEPYTAKPQKIDWHDCRNDRRGPYVETPIRWECNWAAIPREALHDKRLNFDEDYDMGAAYENQDYAFAAMKLGYYAVIDTENVALGLPHKKYWPAQYEAEKPQTMDNKERLARKNRKRGF